MKNWLKLLNLKMDDNTGYNNPGGSSETPPPESKPPETPSEKPPEEGAAPKKELDEFGYEKKESQEPPKTEEKPKKEEPPETEEKPPESVTGYDKPPEKPPEEKKPSEEEKPPEEGELKVADKGELLDEEVDEILSVAKEHKLSQAVVDAMVAKRKEMIEAFNKKSEKAAEERQNEIKKQRLQWYNELKEDQEFGGENFETNVKKVNKLVDEFMPNFKKQLTKSGTMLPPYLMRDFAKLSKYLHSTEKLVEGEEFKEKEQEEKKNSGKEHLEFYNS